jgi:hypothetical protein
MISNVRNELVHYGASSTAEGLIVTNARVAHIPSKIRSQIVSSETLEALRIDLGTINIKLMFELYQDWPDIFDALNEPIAQLGPTPWRYKPPLQGIKGKAARRTDKGTRPPNAPPAASQT